MTRKIVKIPNRFIITFPSRHILEIEKTDLTLTLNERAVI